jgi:hypothetical protein
MRAIFNLPDVRPSRRGYADAGLAYPSRSLTGYPDASWRILAAREGVLAGSAQPENALAINLNGFSICVDPAGNPGAPK